MTTGIAQATICIPTALRGFAGGNASYSVPATTAGEALTQFTAEYPELKTHLYNDEGNLRSFVNIYVGEEDIRYLDGESTALDAGSEITIVPSIAGGTAAPVAEAEALSGDEILRYSRHL